MTHEYEEQTTLAAANRGTGSLYSEGEARAFWGICYVAPDRPVSALENEYDAAMNVGDYGRAGRIELSLSRREAKAALALARGNQ